MISRVALAATAKPMSPLQPEAVGTLNASLHIQLKDASGTGRLPTGVLLDEGLVTTMPLEMIFQGHHFLHNKFMMFLVKITQLFLVQLHLTCNRTTCRVL